MLARAQTDFDVAQTFTKSKLAESHAQELIPTREGFDLIIALIAADAAAKLLGMYQVKNLRKNKLPDIHSATLAEDLLGKNAQKYSNRSHPSICMKPYEKQAVLQI
jgi:hypothetical protein